MSHTSQFYPNLKLFILKVSTLWMNHFLIKKKGAKEKNREGRRERSKKKKRKR